MTLAELNGLPADAARGELENCCGSQRWAAAMAARRPFASVEQLLSAANEEWRMLKSNDWREAFSHHPRIGDRSADGIAKQEQSGTNAASDATIRELANLNRIYEDKFGFVFLIFASGKSAEEMLEALKVRIWNRPDMEMQNAVEEQAKITRLRLQRLVT